jgi:hypothetical protein
MAVVRFDDDFRERVTKSTNLVPAKDYTMARQNFKTLISAAFAKLIAPLAADSPKENAVRKLGVAKELESLARKAADDAKKALAAVGIDVSRAFAPSTTEVVFDSEHYTLTAVTNAGSQRLDQTALSQAMVREGLSTAKAARIINSAMQPVKPSTSLKVEAK